MADSDDLMPEIEATGERLVAAREMIARRIIGQEQVVEQTLIAILSGGHGLLVGAPGLAKTRLVETLGTVLGLVAHRVQFTPDLMPADILGAEVLETGADGSRAFRFIDGPIFCQLLMADEINRASPRTQSALLQAMQEKEVSVAGQRRILPRPFHVLATQNPIEQEGTYPLPEAQLDRFLLQIDVDYPDRGGGAGDHPGHHRRRRGGGGAGVRRREPDGGAAADPPAAGRRGGGRAHPRPGARGAAGLGGGARRRCATR